MAVLTLQQALTNLQTSMLNAAGSTPSVQQAAQQEYQTFYDAITSNPTLVAALDANLANSLDNGFDYVATPTNIGGILETPYSGAYVSTAGAIIVGASFLQNTESNGATANQTAQNIASFIGHENQHASNSINTSGIDGVAIDSSQENSVVLPEIQNGVAAGNDITSLINAGTTVDLNNESSAYIAGYNTALASAVAQNNGVALNQAQLSAFQSLYSSEGFGAMLVHLPSSAYSGDGSLALNASNITTLEPFIGYLVPSGQTDPISGANSATATYYDLNASYYLNSAEKDLSTSGGTVNANFSQMSLANGGTNNGSAGTALNDEQIDEALLTTQFNCGSKSSCSVVDTSSNTTNYFNIGVATSNGGTTDTIVTAQPLSSSSSSSESVSGSDINVTADNENINASADSSDTLNVTGSTNTVISASGVLTSLQGNDNVDQLANGSSALTESGDINNTITCGNSTANINGVSADSCSITPAGNSTLTVDGSSLTGSLQGNVILTESGDTFDAESNANITMATGDTVDMGAGTSGVQLICGSDKETISNGTSGSDSAQCTIADDGTGVFNNGNSLTIADAGGALSVIGNNDNVAVASGTASAIAVNGQNDSVNASQGTVAIAANSQVSVVGASEAITSGSGAITNIQGNNDTDNATGGTINAAAGDTGETISGAGLTLDGTGLFSGLVTGASDTFNLAASSGSTLSISGTGDVANSVGNTILLDGTNSTATVDGANTVDLEAASQSLSLGTIGDTITTIAGDTGETITGSGLTLDGTGLFSGVVTGTNDTFNLAASCGSTLGLSGTGDIANSVGNTIQVDGASSTATVAGADTVDLEAANQKLTLSTTGDTVDTTASDTGEAITGSGLTLDGTGLFSGVVTGSNDIFNLAASSGSTLGISGTADVANSVGNTIQLDGASSAATVAGADTVDLEAANQALTLSKTGDTVDTIASDTGEAITGSGLTLDGTGLFSGVVTGSNDVFNLAASSGSTLGISGTADVANSVGNTIQLDGASSTATVAGADTVDLQAANQTLTLNSTSGDTVDAVKNDTDETIDGSGFTLNGASGLTGYIGGSNDTLDLVSNSGTSLGLIGGGDTVNSVGNAINLGAAGSSADVVGSGNTLGLESTGQWLTASSGNTIDTSANSTGDLLSCTSDTIDGGSGFSALISGTNNTINLTANSGSGVELYGSGDTTNAVDDAVYLNAASISDTVVGSGDKVGLNASGDILSMSSAGDTVDAAANSTGDLITGTSETIDGGSGFTGLISGTNNAINLTANSGSGVSLYSSGDTTNAVGDAVFLNAASIDETVTGAGDKVYLNTAGDQLTMSTSGDTVDTAANATGEIVAGSGETIDGASDYTGFIVGSNDTANLTSNSSSSIAFFGQNDVANSVGNNLYLAQAGDSGTVIGSDNTISLNASTQVLTVDTAGDTVSTAVNDTGETITATGDTIDGNTGFNGNVLGSNDTVSLDANSGSYVGVYGSNQTVDSTGNSINLAASASATINGVDTIGLCGVNDSLTLDSQGDTVNTLASDTGETITATDATVNGSTGSFSLNGNSNTFNDGSDASLNISGTGDNVSMGSGGYVGLVSGTSDTISLNSGTIVTLNNVGGTFDGSGNTISAGSGTFAIDGNSNKFGDGADTSINISGTGDTVSVGNGSYVGLVSGTSDTIDLTDGTIDTLNNVGGTVDGSGDTINAGNGNFVLDGNSDVFHGAADDPLSISGQNDTIYQSNATIDITGNDTTTIDGSNDKIVGGSGDKFTITGTDDDVSATDSSVAFDGTNTGDDVVGASDTGSNWAAPDPDDGSGDGGYGGYSGGGDGGGDGGYGYGFVKWKGRSPDAAKVAKYAGASQSSVYEQASWADKTVTWSFAQGNQATQSSDPFSSYVNAPQEEAAVEEAFQAWAKASGLNFVEVPDSAASDIRVGFGDLNTSTSNVIGLTNYTSTNGQLNAGAVVRLEDPSQTALVAGSNGQLVYGSTDASLEQVALHEIGHALGLADNGNADSVMDYLLSSSNQSLSATDVAGIQSLYGSGSSSSPPSSSVLGVNNQLHQLVQAMASFDASDGAWESSDPLVPAMHHTASLAATSAMSSHLARVA